MSNQPMKAIKVKVCWLDEVNGETVAKAIEYLQSLPADHVLNYWQSAGDDQGVEISSGLVRFEPYTEQELKQLRVDRMGSRVKDAERSLRYYDEKVSYYEGVSHYVAENYRQKQLQASTKLTELRLQLEELKKELT